MLCDAYESRCTLTSDTLLLRVYVGVSYVTTLDLIIFMACFYGELGQQQFIQVHIQPLASYRCVNQR